MTQSWIEAEFHDHWTLSAEELTLLPGMTDKGRLGFALQLKFMQLRGRLPESHEEFDPAAAQWLATQLHAPIEIWSTYQPISRQGQRHQRIIRTHLGFRPAAGNDVRVLAQWLREQVLPFDPQRRHGLDRAIEWCRAQGLEPPATESLKRIVRSAVHRFEADHHERMYARLSDSTRAQIDRLLRAEGCAASSDRQHREGHLPDPPIGDLGRRHNGVGPPARY